MMKWLFLLLLFTCVSSVKHSLKSLSTSTTGIRNIPDLIVVGVIDDVQVASCSSDKRMEISDTFTKVLEEYNLHDWLTVQCYEVQPRRYRTSLHGVMDHFNHSGGVHSFQVILGCEWDDDTGETSGFMKSGYDGEDLMELDLKTKTWISLRPDIAAIKEKSDKNIFLIQEHVVFITQLCPLGLKSYVGYKNKSTAPPSVSLLQTSPSSPISCYATGFYPHRAEMFWRKDGEQIHGGVDQGEILPNHDGTFQMRVDLDLSSVRAEDWRRYDCVFQLSGVKDDVITKLDKAVIRTNWGRTENSVLIIIIIIISLVVLCVVVAAVVTIYKKHKAPEQGSELAEQLNPEGETLQPTKQ